MRRVACKPCDQLTPADFEGGRVWGFDLDLEGVPGADETWVRPYEFTRVPRHHDTLFAGATLSSPSGRLRAGAVSFRFEGGRPELDPGVVLLEPHYSCIPCGDDGVVAPWAVAELLGESTEVEAIFPLSYRATVRIGKREFVFEGRLTVQ